jgi:hypothetical protein
VIPESLSLTININVLFADMPDLVTNTKQPRKTGCAPEKPYRFRECTAEDLGITGVSGKEF